MQEPGFLKFYRSLPEKLATTIRVFDWTDNYTIHGKDAVFVAREIFKNSDAIKYLGKGDQRIESIAMNNSNFEGLARDLLLVKHYRVEIFTNKGGSKSNGWTLSYKASPGNLIQLEDILFSNAETLVSGGVAGLKIANDEGELTVGIGYTDPILKTFTVSEFSDNDQFSNLEAALVQLGAKECVVCMGESAGDASKLKQVIARSGLLLTERKKADFSNKDIVQDFDRLLKPKKGEKPNNSTLAELEKSIAMSALSAVIRYLELVADEENFGQFKLTTFDLSLYMKLDAAAVRALSLLPVAGELNKNHSLFGLLNKCRTPQGQRLLSQWIKQPLMDVDKIEERLNVVEAMLEDTELRQTLHDDQLRKIPDFQKLSKKFQKKRATLQDCYRVYHAIDKMPLLLETLEKMEGKHNSLLMETFSNPIKELLMVFSKFQDLVETTVDLTQVQNLEFVIRADFDDRLLELRQKCDELEADIKSQLNKVARDLSLEPNKTIKLESSNAIGYFFRVTRKEEKALRNNKRYHTIDTKNNGVRFHNTAVRQLNEEYRQVKEEYNEQQKSVVAEVISVAAGYVEPMSMMSDILAQLDVLVAFSMAASAATIPYVRPTLLRKGEGVLRLTEVRHPCLEVQDKVSYIPNDAMFEKDSKLFHIITGPNMGGKSTYIRSIGVTVLMAQIGCYVPCSSAEVSITDCILARVGAGDSQQKGFSTFMAEMLETASLLRSATSNSLIIIDELGRGTSTHDGFGLAWAISEHISTKIECFCVFATHFHELTALADVVPTVNNLHVTALTTDKNLTLLYQVKPGVSDQSFGIHIAEIANFPKHVIEAAQKKANEIEDLQSLRLEGEGRGDCDEPSLKKRKIMKQEGDSIIKDFLSKMKQLSAESLSESDLVSKVNEIMKEVKAKDNQYIKDLLAGCKRNI